MTNPKSLGLAAKKRRDLQAQNPKLRRPLQGLSLSALYIHILNITQLLLTGGSIQTRSLDVWNCSYGSSLLLHLSGEYLPCVSMTKVCMHACKYSCMHVCMYVCMYVCM